MIALVTTHDRNIQLRSSTRPRAISKRQSSHRNASNWRPWGVEAVCLPSKLADLAFEIASKQSVGGVVDMLDRSLSSI